MELLRKIFFYIFAAIYIAVCPLLIMFAFGYIYEPGTEKGYVKTGLIYLSTAPSGATVYMNGAEYARKTPAVIRELLAGDYRIKLAFAGRQSWEHDVPVEDEKATVLDKVLLLPDEWKSVELIERKLSGLTVIPKSGKFLVSSGPAAGDVLVCDYEKGKVWPLFAKGSALGEGKVVGVTVREGSTAVLVDLSMHGGVKRVWVDLTPDNNTVKDVTHLLPGTTQRLEWEPGGEDVLIAYRNGSLSKIDVREGALYPDLIKDVKGFGLSGGQIYGITGDGLLRKYNLEGKVEGTVLGDKDIGKRLFGGKAFFRVITLDGDIMLFLGSDGRLLSNRLPYSFADKGVRGVKPDDRKERVLLWEKDRIGVVDFSAERTGNVPFEKGPSLVWLYKGGKDIEQCFWVYGSSHVLFRDGDDLSMIEVESYGEFHSTKIFSVKPGTDIYYSEGRGMLYFLDTPDGILRSTEIVPSKGLIEVPFPDISKQMKKNRIQQLQGPEGGRPGE